MIRPVSIVAALAFVAFSASSSLANPPGGENGSSDPVGCAIVCMTAPDGSVKCVRQCYEPTDPAP